MLNRRYLCAFVFALFVFCFALVPIASANVTTTPSVSTTDSAAGGHGVWTFSATYANGSGTSETLRRAIYDFPAGMSYNAAAVPAADLCPQATFDTGICAAASQVGTVTVSAAAILGIFSTTITDLPGTISVISTSGGVTKLGLYFSSGGFTLRATEQISTASGNVVRVTTDDLPKTLTASGQTATFQITKLEQKFTATLASGANFLTNPTACGTWSSFIYSQAYDSNTNANSDPLASGSNQFVKSAALNVTGTCPADTTPPAAPTVSGPSGTVASTSASITITPAEAGGTVQGSLDSAAYATATSPVSLSALAQGTHTYSARQIDAAGNIGSAATITWTVDTVAPAAPTLSRTSPTASPTNSATQSISIAPAESGGTLQGSLDGAAFATATSPVSLSALGNGSHTYQARQLDAVGNVGAVAQVTWTVDTIAPAAPTLARTTPSVTPTNSVTQSISITPAESGGTLQGSLDGAAFATATSPVSLSALGNGSHTYQSRQVDAAGNLGAVAQVTWTVDIIAPAAPTLSGPSGTVNLTTASISITAAESGGTLQGSLDGAAFATATSPVSLSALGNGSHTYQARQLDAVGNVGSVAAITWTVDTVPPLVPGVTRTSPTANPTNSVTQAISIAPAESGGTLQGSLDGAAFTTTTSSVSLSALGNGSHTYQARQIDAAGNLSSVAQVTWTVDTIAPSAPTLSGPSGTVVTTTASISITPAESGGVIQGNLDGAAFATVTSPVSLSGLGNGAHTYSARQIDAAGNTGSAASISWTVNTTVPAAPSIDSGPSGATSSSSASFTFSSSESGVTFETSLDGASFAAGTSPAAFTNLAEGGHSFAVRAKNAVATTGPATTRSWTVDTIAPAAPTLARTSPTASPTNSATQTISIAPAESGGSLQGSLDGAAFGAVTSPASLSGLSNGQHTYQARQVDAAGNLGAAGQVTWTVDVVAPLAPTLSGPSGTVTTTSASITITPAESGGVIQGNLDGAAFATVTSPVSLTGLGNGPHTYSARQIDAAGNTGSAASISWTINSTVPAAPSIDSGPTGLTNSASASFAFSSSESGVTFETSLDGAAYAPGTSPAIYSGLAQGAHSFAVRAKNAVATVGPATTRSWSVDTIAPAAPAVSGPAGTVSSTSASISVIGAESGGTLQGSLDSAAFGTITSPVSLSALGNGAHTYSARQIDAAGNTGSATSISWTVNTSVPAAPTIDSGPSGPTSSASASFAFSSSESGVTFETSIDGAGFAAGTSPATYSGLAQGAHSFAVRAKNAVGTTGPATTRSWTVDTIGPAAPTLSGPSGTVATTTASISIAPAESGGTLQGSLDGAAFAAVTSPANLSSLGDGPHTYQARQVDAAGNNGAAASISWTVDTSVTPPQLPGAPTISAGPSGLTSSTSASFSFSSGESGVTFEVSLDGGSFAGATSPKTYSGLLQGGHTFAVRAKNAAGSGPAVTRAWTVDTVAPAAPTVTRTSPTTSPTSSTSQTIAIGGVEAGGVLQGRLDGAAFAAAGATVSLSGLAGGSHTYEARVTDAAGNVGAAASVTWTVDTVAPAAPTVTRTNPTATPTTSTTQALSVGGAEAGATLQGRLDGAAFAAVGATVNLTGLAVGSHTYQVRQIDAAGNVSAVGQVTWSVSTPTTPPPNQGNVLTYLMQLLFKLIHGFWPGS